MTQRNRRIRAAERDSIIQSLKAGVCPRVGIQHIQVGRVNEIEAINKDIERIANGGSAFRLIIGEYGSGKTFFLNLVRSIALEKHLVSVYADLSPDRRIHASAGQARNLYSELMRNLATRTLPQGSALPSIVERFINLALQEAEKRGVSVSSVINDRLSVLSEHVGGFDFAKVVEAYWRGHESDNDQLKLDALRWLRAEFSTRTDTRKALGVRDFISDTSFYSSLKIMSLFVRQAGYSGLLVCLDEMVNLYKLSNTKARLSNYEQILWILNDCLQGTAEHMGFLLGGTPEFLLDTRRGLYSYEALQSRLAENSFAQRAGVTDYSSPTLRLDNLTPEEVYILLGNIRHVYASGDKSQYLVPDETLEAFLLHCSQTIGDAYFRTPRNTIKAFADMLSVLDQNKTIAWNDLVGTVAISEDRISDMPEIEDSPDGLSSFTL
ncbi:MAG: ATP-binding protein [Caldilineaceae bacterium]|nr:ATP-binding protein [Caldilineaceae bacterium]MCY4117135.1 ATP-binding protein [Caldilineaceae bacterium]